VIDKYDAGSTPVGGASFTISPDPTPGSNAGSLSVVDGGLNDTDNTANGVITVSPAEPGSYTVTETSAPTGYFLPATADRSQTLTVAESGTATFAFHDPAKWQPLTATKTAVGSYDASYAWSIDKTVANNPNGTPDSSATQHIPAGGTASYHYNVTVTEGARVTSHYLVSGKVHVDNPNTAAVTATLSDALPGATCTFSDADTDPLTAGVQVAVPAGGKDFAYGCTYGAVPASTTNVTNSATVSWSKAAYPQTQADVGASGSYSLSPSATFDFAVDNETNKTVTVRDDHHTFSPAWTITWSGDGVSVSKGYDVSDGGTAGTCTTTDNTATIVETGQSESASRTVCDGADLTVTKNAVTSLTRTYLWDIQKAASATRYDVDQVTGSATAHYTVTVNRNGNTDSGWQMSGSITVHNPNDWESVTVTGISDVYDGGGSCSISDVNPDLVIEAGTSQSYHYTCTFASQPAYTGVNTATVTWDKAVAATPDGSAVGTVAVTEAQWSLAKVNDTVSVYDDYSVPGDHHLLGTVSVDDTFPKTFTYDVTLAGAPGTCTAYTNTAWLTGTAGKPTGDQDSATVKVCEPLGLAVTKTASGSIDRTYHWTIAKAVDDTAVTTDGDGHTFRYTVTATPNGYSDSGWTMTGTISVSNLNTDGDIAPITADVTDVPNVGGGATCQVFGGNDVVLVSNETVSLAYMCSFTSKPGYSGGTNTATATWDNQSASSSPVPVSFAVGHETDKDVAVYDDQASGGAGVQLGTAHWGNGATDFVYDLTQAGTAGQCTSYTNDAWLGAKANPVAGPASASAQLCVRKALTVHKTVDASYSRTYLWQIQKQADKTRAEIGVDGTARFDYTVTATPDGYSDAAWQMSGVVTVTNPNSAGIGAITTDVTDLPSVGAGVSCSVTGGAGVSVPAGGSVELPYSCSFGGSAAPHDGTNTATATWAAVSGPDLTAGDTEAVVFSQADQNASVDVYDDQVDQGPNGVLLGSATWNANGTPTVFTYAKSFTGVAGTCSDYTNTAWLAQTSQEAQKTVTVCVEEPLVVSKTADTSFRRTYLWQLAKQADKTDVEITDGGSAKFHYTVSATPSGYTDDDWQLSGQITVTNPNGYADGSITTDVTDAPNIGGGATCSVTDGTGVDLAPGGSATLDYTCDVPNRPEYNGGVNTATAAWTDPEGADATATGTTGVTFSDPTKVNKTVTVTDDMVSHTGDPAVLGTAEWNASGAPVEFGYDLTLDGVAGQCQDYTNTAAIVQTDQSAHATVTVCRQGDLTLANVVSGDYDRAYDWSIDKVADKTRVQLAEPGQSATINYTVDATPGAFADSGWTMSGALTVANPNGYKAVTVDVATLTDLGGGAGCSLDPGQDTEIAAGATTTFTYSCTFVAQPAYTGTETSTVSWEGGSVDLTSPVELTLDQETDKTVTVVDDKTVPGTSTTLGQATWNSTGTPVTFQYSLPLTAKNNECEDYTNTAQIVETEQSADATVTVCGVKVKGTQAHRPPPTVKGTSATLPNTGGPSGWYVAGGSLLVMLGCGLLLGGRRRRRHA